MTAAELLALAERVEGMTGLRYELEYVAETGWPPSAQAKRCLDANRYLMWDLERGCYRLSQAGRSALLRAKAAEVAG